MAADDSGCEAYTAIAWGVGLSHIVHDSPLWMPKPRLFLVPVLGLAAVAGSVGAVGMAGLTLRGG